MGVPIQKQEKVEITGGLGVEENVRSSREIRQDLLTLDESYHTDNWQICVGRLPDLTGHVSRCRWD